MSTRTASARGTQSLTITPTQNTAPVHEFRCMFSHDLRKKQKKWHDGSVRFHTFNKRVMVYDEVKNFIGDLHYRDDDEFGEGTELQLDRGVLVHVEDRIGQTETDLAPLLDRRRHEDDQGSGRTATQARSTLSRPSAASTERPKSLTAVLGRAHGPIGRVRVANRSPFEGRQATIADRIDGPLAKRRRLSGDEENDDDHRSMLTRLTPRTEYTRVASKASVSCIQPSAKARDSAGLIQPIVIASSPEPMETCTTPAVSAQRAKAQRVNSSANSRLNDMTTKDGGLPGFKKSKQKGVVHPGSASATTWSETTTSVHGYDRWDRRSLEGKTPLLFSQQPPRRKLLYNTSASTPLRQSTAPSSSPDIVRIASGELEASKGRSPEQQSLSASFEPRETSVNHSKGSQDQSASSLSFVFPVPKGVAAQQYDIQNPPLSPKGSDIKEPDHFGSISGASASRTRDVVSPITPRCQRVDSIVGLEQHSTRPLSSATVPSQSLMPLPQPILLRRAPSENDSSGQGTPALNSGPLDNIAAELSRPKHGGIPSLAQASESPHSLQRSVSDISSVKSGTTPRHDIDQDQDSDCAQPNSTGPWTQMEAYLLFEWWPPDRQKPVFGGCEAHIPLETDGLDGRGRFIDEMHDL